MASVISGDANVSAAEFGYLDGVTSGLQSQIDAKAADSSVGLKLITSETFSAVSSVSIDDVFTSAYQNYSIIANVTATTSASLTMRMRASGTDDTGSNYHRQRLEASGTAVSAIRTSSQTSFLTSEVRPSALSFALLVTNPQAAAITQIWIHDNNYAVATVSNPFLEISAGNVNTASQYDGFTFTAASGSITGTIRVYGYRN